MIPFYDFPALKLGPISVHVFGVMVALGVWAGTELAARAARKRVGPEAGRVLAEAGFWGLVGGLIGGHLLHVLGYHPELLREQGPLVLLRFWDGLSSMGGLLGGLAGIALHFARSGRKLMPYLDSIALGTAPGWAIARIGCIAAHDHPGVHTHFFLAVMYPDGPRHDLGLDDFLVLAALSAVLWLLARKPRPVGLLTGVLAVGYSVPRFLLDFLRARPGDVAFADGRIFGLTPAQYVTAALVPVGIWLIARALAHAPAPQPQEG